MSSWWWAPVASSLGLTPRGPAQTGRPSLALPVCGRRPRREVEWSCPRSAPLREATRSVPPPAFPRPGLGRAGLGPRGSGALYSARGEPRVRGKPSTSRVGEGCGGGAVRGRGAGAGRRKGRDKWPKRPPRSGAPAPGPGRPACPARYTRGKVFPRPLPASPRLLGSSPRRRSSTMPDSFDTLQRQRPEGGGRGGRGGEREGRGDVSWERGECLGHSPKPLFPKALEIPACPPPR